MSGSSERKKAEAGKDAKAEKPKQNAKAQPASDQVSRALRSVYDDTLRENIPSEFEDLLKKLS